MKYSLIPIVGDENEEEFSVAKSSRN